MASESTATEKEICCGGKCVFPEIPPEILESAKSASGKISSRKGFNSEAIIEGASLVGTTIEQISRAINTCRNVAIQITNCSETHTVKHPRVYTFSGKSYDPPQPTIPTSTREACSFSKTANTACGAVGVLTYKIFTGEKRCIGELAIMFSVPYGRNLYENWFALGVFDPDTPCDENLYNKMYNGNGPFTRAKGSGNSITYGGKRVFLEGTMSPQCQAIMKVEFVDD